MDKTYISVIGLLGLTACVEPQMITIDYLSSVFFKLPAEGGSIITDGSNAFGTRLDYMLSGRLRIGNFVVLLENNSRYGDALYEFKVSPA